MQNSQDKKKTSTNEVQTEYKKTKQNKNPAGSVDICLL